MTSQASTTPLPLLIMTVFAIGGLLLGAMFLGDALIHRVSARRASRELQRSAQEKNSRPG